MDSIDNGQTGDDSANTMSKESSIVGFIDCVGDKEEDAELNDDNGDSSKSSVSKQVIKDTLTSEFIFFVFLTNSAITQIKVHQIRAESYL